jgi:hypothetical protein
MRIRAWPYLSAALLALPACDCNREVSALVIDARSGRPIEGASIRERNDNGTYEDHQDLTNGQGVFDFADISGGLRGCPPVQLHIARQGYVPVDREFQAGARGDTVLLEPESRF